MTTEYYKLLGVQPTATTQAIRKAYLAKARASHPDNFGDNPPPDAQKQMQQLNEAWQCLQDTETRAAYDKQLASKAQQKIMTVTNDFSTVQNVAQHRQRQEAVHTEKQKRSFRTILIAFAVLGVAALVVFSFLSPAPVQEEPPTLPTDINLGANIEIGDCVSVQTGPSLLEVPCDVNATGRVVSAGAACVPTAQELVLQNNVAVCLIGV